MLLSKQIAFLIMATISRGILGGFKGSVANVVGSSWKGIATMKSKPLSVANPRTAGQVGQRTKFTEAVKLAKYGLGNYVKPLWDRFAVKQSGYNAFVQKNIAFISDTGVVDYGQLNASVGTLGGLSELEMSVNFLTNLITLSWSDDSGTGNKLATDEVYVLVIAKNNAGGFGLSNIANRADEGAIIDWSSLMEDTNQVYVYVSCRRSDGTIVSNSQYLTAAE